MVFPATPQDVEVGILIDDVWVDAVETGDGVYNRDPVTIKTGRSNWTARTDSGHASFLLANRDGRWSPDNDSGAYFGLLRRNLPTRIGVGRGDPYLGHVPGSSDLASTPNVGGGGGGSPTTPSIVSITESAETVATTTHDVTMPTVTVGDRVLVSIAAAHNSLTHTADFDPFAVLHAVSLHGFHRWLVYELSIHDAATVTAISGQTLQFSTTANAKSSAFVVRTSGVRPGGVGVSFAVSAPAWNGVGSAPFGDDPDSPSLTRPAGWATQVRWLSLYTAGGTGAAITTNPAGFTAGADGNTASGVTVGVAHLASTSSPIDPGAFDINDDENWDAITIAYQPTEVAGAAGSLDIAGDLEARIEFQLHDDPLETLVTDERVRLAHRTSGANGWEWELFQRGGEIHTGFIWRDTSGVSHRYETFGLAEALPRAVTHDRVALRFTLDADNGSSESVGRFYYSFGGIDGSFTEVASGDTGEGETDIQVTAAALKVGGNTADGAHNPITGKVFAFRLYDGIGGTPVADIDFEAQTLGDTSFVGGEGETWTVGAGARITDMRWRFHGELASLPVRWGPGGFDVWAPMEATGLFRRLRQGNRRLESPIRRAIIRSAASLVAYWPMEEQGNGYTTYFGPAKGTKFLVGSVAVPNTGANTSFLASDALPTLGETSLSTHVDTYTGTGAWQVRWLQSVPDGFTGDGLAFMQVWTTDIVWEIEFRDDAGGDLRIVGYRGVTIVYDSGWVAFGAIDKNWRMSLEVRQNGANVDVALNAQDPLTGAIGGFGDTSAVAGSAGTVTEIRINKDSNVGTWAFGHLTLQSAITSNDEMAEQLDAYQGEAAGDRIVRLCREEGIATRIVGDPAESEAMGPQRSGTLMTLLEECADTDLGMLFEPRETTAVGYRCRTSIIDQTPQVELDYDASHIFQALELDRDDQNFANDVEVVNWTGTTARAVLDDGTAMSVSEPPVGAGRYDDTFQVNGDDTRLQALANSRLALASVDEPRISRLIVALHTAALVADPALTQDLLGHLLGDRVLVENVLPIAVGETEINQIVQGVRETFDGFTHALQFLTTPASPWGLLDVPPDVDPAPEDHHVAFRSQLTLAYSGSPPHVLTALGYSLDDLITRADLDDILDDWVASTGGTTRNVTSTATWTTAIAAAVPGDLVRTTADFTIASGQLSARGNLYGLSGSTMTASPGGGSEGLPIICSSLSTSEVTGSGLTNNVPVLDVVNNRHVWTVGFNVAGTSQFGIRGMNTGGTAGFPAYHAYNSVNGVRDASIAFQGWFQLITTSGGTPPAGSGNTWGYSEWIVVEENDCVNPNPGEVAGNPGEGIYFGRGASPGWVSYVKDGWMRGNRTEDYVANGFEVKPGCRRIRVTDCVAYLGRGQNGAPFELCYQFSGLDDRPSYMNDIDGSGHGDIEVHVSGCRVYDYNLTETGTTRNQMFLLGMAGVRISFCMAWSARDSSGNFGSGDNLYAVLIQSEKDVADFGNTATQPTYVVNCNWQARKVTNLGAADGAITGVISRNNITPSGYGGEFTASSADYIATTPAVGSLSEAEWETYGPGSAFDLDPESSLVGTGVSIADLDLAIDADISQRAIPATPNPGPFQPYVA